MRHSRLLTSLALAGTGSLIFACDKPTAPPIHGVIAPRMVLGPAPAGWANAVLTQVRATVSGNSSKIVNLTLDGTKWVGTADSLLPGTYSIVVEGLSSGEIERFGQATGVNVAAGQTAQPSITFHLVQTATAVISPSVTTAFALPVHYNRIVPANGYVIQVSPSANFDNALVEATDPDTTANVTVGSTGTFHVRVRPIVPSATSAIKWSTPQSFQVVDDGTARSLGTATLVNLVSSAPDTVRDRNITAAGPESWYAFNARAGDSILVHTVAARLPVPSPLNTVLSIFRADGTTLVASNDNAPVTSVTAGSAAASSPTTDSEIATVAPATETYHIRVTGAANTVGNYMLVNELRRLPAAPTSMGAVAASATSTVLSWTDNADNEVDFKVERCTGASCTDFVEIATVAAGSETHSDQGLTEGASYNYRVRARNVVGYSGYSNTATVRTAVPNAPSNLTATTISSGQIDLAWTDNSTDETGFRIEQCEGDGCTEFTEVAVAAANASGHSVSGLSVNTLYTFRVRSTNAIGHSAYTSAATAGTFVPTAPTGIAVLPASPTSVDLSWTDNATNETAFTIESCVGTGCSDFAPIGSVAANVTTFQATGLTVSLTYRFRVIAVNVSGTAASAPIEIALLAPTPATALSATTVSGSDIELSWTDNSNNESGFRIERCAGAGCSNFELLQTVAANATSYQDVGLSLNTSYSYRVQAFNGVGAAAHSNVASANTNVPSDPTGLIATTISATQIDLSWGDASGETGYHVERCSGAGCTEFAIIASPSADATSYTDASVVADQSYTYRVSAFNVAGSSAVAGPVTATTFVPAAPSGLTAAVFSTTRIDLAWTDNADNEDGYRIERCTGEGCTDFSQIDVVAAGVIGYQDGSVSAAQTYTYRVRAYNGSGTSAFSNNATAATAVPAAATGLTGVLAGATQLDLSWTDNSFDETGFRVQRCTGAGCNTDPLNFSEIAVVDVGITTYSDASIVATETYAYRVLAFNAVGDAAPSNEFVTSVAVPDGPTALAASTVSGSRIDLTWTDNSSNEQGFAIERCEGVSCSSFSQIATVGPNVTSYQNSELTLNQSYSYRVTAFNGAGSSAVSNTATANTLVPAAPTGLAATTISSVQVNLAWTDAASNELSYELERCAGTSCSDFAVIATLGENAISHADIGLTPNISYRYRVRALNAAGASAYSDIATAETNIPIDPSGLAVIAMSSTRIDLSWSDNSTNEDGFIIERCAGVGCSDFAPLPPIAANLTSYQDEGLSADTWYSYRVQAFHSTNGSSRHSNIASAITSGPAAPTGLLATTVNGGRIDLAWADNSDDELGFRIERCTGGACSDFAQIAELGGASSYSDESVALNTTYTYRVLAYNNVAASAYTNEATANTIIPADPANLAATTIAASQIELTWQDNANNEAGFRVERCAGDGCSEFTQVASLNPDAVAYQDNTLSAQTAYTYRVAAFNVAGTSNFVGPVTATTIVPAAPSGLAAATVSNSRIDVTWTDNADNEQNVQIERCTGIGCSSYVQIGTVTADVTTFANTGLSSNTFYTYRVRAVNAAGVSPYTTPVSANTFAPATPTSFTATTIFGNRIDLSWSDVATNETGYRVERCAGAGCSDFAEVVVLAQNVTSYEDAALTINTNYSYRVQAINGVGASAYATASANTFVPPDPTALTATTVGAGQIDLAWADNAGNEVGYRVERCVGVGCSDFAQLADLGANATSYSDAGLAAATSFSYRVRAYNIGSSGYTNVATATTILPSAPTNLIATAASNDRVDLSWTDNSTNEYGFRIERCTGAECGDFVEIATVGPDVTSYENEPVDADQTFTYRVRAYNGAGTSAYSNAAASATTVPAIPTALAAATTSATQIDLSWSDNSSNETGFEIERCAGAGCSGFALIATNGAGDFTYADMSVSGGQPYRYRVRAINGSGASTYSNTVTLSAGAPVDPSALVGTTLGPTLLRVQWVDNADNEVSYRIERCAGASCTDFTEIDQAAADATQYDDNTVAFNTAYRYRIRGANAAGFSGYAGPLAATTLPPADPTVLTASTVAATQINLSWTDNADNELAYEVERCQGFGCLNFVQITVLAAGTTEYEDAAVTAGSVFQYRVRATNNAGQSAYSNVADATTNLPATPAGVAAVATGATQITLSWTDLDNEDNYHIERCTGAACSDFAPLATVAADVVTYQDNSVSGAESYRYRMRASNGAGSSGYSDVAAATTILPAAPSGLFATTVSDTRIDLVWADNADNEFGYRIESCTGVGCTTFTEIAVVGADVTTFEHSGLTTGEYYRYRVRAHNGAGTSAYSNEATANTLPPADPSSLVALTASADAVELSWTDNADNEVTFRIERCAGVGCSDFIEIAQVGANTTTYLSGGLAASTSYSFRVRAVNPVGSSGYSNEAAATTIPPAAPTGLIATTLSASQIDLSWADNSDNELGFRIERCAGIGCTSFVEIASVGPDETTFSNTGLSLNTTYTYRVRAYNNVSPSDYSNESTANTIVPAAPSSVVADAVTGSRVDLTWTDNADNETQFHVERCDGAGCSFTEIATVAANSVGYSDTGAPFGMVLAYRVRASNVAGASAFVGDTASTVLNAPTNPVALTNNRTSITVTWADNSTIETAYQVWRCALETCADGDFVLLANRPANTVSLTNSGLSANTKYTYRVRAITAGGVSAFAAPAYARTPLVLSSDVPVSGIADASQGRRHYVIINVPAGTAQLRVNITGGVGDADLYVKHAAAPSTLGFVNTATECAPFIGGNEETCTFNSPAAGEWYIMLHAFSEYSGVQLTATYSENFGYPTQFAGTGAGWNGNFVLWQPIFVSKPISVTHLGVIVSGGAGNMRIGLYSNRFNGLVAEPSSLLVSAEGAISGAGIREFSVTPTVIPAGTYWIATLTDTFIQYYLNTGGATVTWKYISSSYGTGLPAVAPAPAGTPSLTNFTRENMNYYLRGIPQ